MRAATVGEVEGVVEPQLLERPAAAQQVQVGVDEAGRDEAAAQVDDVGALAGELADLARCVPTSSTVEPADREGLGERLARLARPDRARSRRRGRRAPCSRGAVLPRPERPAGHERDQPPTSVVDEPLHAASSVAKIQGRQRARHERQHVRRPAPAGTASARPSPRRRGRPRSAARAGGRSARTACGSSPAPRGPGETAKRSEAPADGRLEARHVVVAGQRLPRHVEEARELRHRARERVADERGVALAPGAPGERARRPAVSSSSDGVERARGAAPPSSRSAGRAGARGARVTSAQTGPSQRAFGAVPGREALRVAARARARAAGRGRGPATSLAEGPHDAVAHRVDRGAPAPRLHEPAGLARGAGPSPRPPASGRSSSSFCQRARKSARSSSWIAQHVALARLVDARAGRRGSGPGGRRGRSRRRPTFASLSPADDARVGRPDAAARRVHDPRVLRRERASRPSAVVPSAHEAGTRPSKPTRRGMRPMIVQPMRPSRVGHDEVLVRDARPRGRAPGPRRGRRPPPCGRARRSGRPRAAPPRRARGGGPRGRCRPPAPRSSTRPRASPPSRPSPRSSRSRARQPRALGREVGVGVPRVGLEQRRGRPSRPRCS